MFVLAELKDIVRTPPSDFDEKLKTTIAKYLNNKLVNKVVKDVGLCIGLFDILELGNSYIFPGDGAAHTKVDFRFVIFRPFIEEVILGKIKSSTKEGVHVTIDFFDDIMIPAANLQHPSRFDEVEEVWIWEFDNNGDKHDLFMDKGEQIKFRVASELFAETSPSTSTEDKNTTDIQPPAIPFSLIGTINEPGLGLLTWWDGS